MVNIGINVGLVVRGRRDPQELKDTEVLDQVGSEVEEGLQGKCTSYFIH